MSDSINSSGEGRRNFLKAALRGVLFGGFVLTGLHLADRPDSLGKSGSACPGAEDCARCARLGSCSDSRAVLYKSSPAAQQPDEQLEKGFK